MIGALIGIVLAVIVLILLYYFLKRVVHLIINAVVGVIALFLLNLLNVSAWFGNLTPIPINLVTILVCAIGGLPGVVIVIVLHFLNVL